MEKSPEQFPANTPSTVEAPGEGARQPTPGEKKQFVEPAVSDPTNVLEDTKFFFQTSVPPAAN